MRLVAGVLEADAVGLEHAELVQSGHDRLLVEDAHHHRLPMDTRQRHYAQVDMAPVNGQTDTTVLRQAPLGDVHLGHDLHPRDRACSHPPGDSGDVMQDPVDSEAHAQLASVGRQVHIGGALLDGLRHDLVDKLDNRRVLSGLAQVDHFGADLLHLFDVAILLGDHVLEPV